MEYPHNLFPAMHITLCLILADLYGRHTRGILRGFVYFWFGLIGLSTVLTWQHHLVDVAGGLVLGGFAFYLFRESSRCPPVAVNVRIGCFYAAGAMIALAAMPLFWPWGIFLLWPAASLGLVSGAYFGLGPSIFRKTGGCLPVSARFVLAPILMGQFLSLIYYRRQCRAWNWVAPGLIIGRVLNPTEAAAAMEQGVTAVLDLTAEFTETTPFRKIAYRNLPILDLTAPTPGQLRQAVAFINAEAARGIVYVHCKIGYSRSAAVAGAYLLASQQAATAEEAVNMLRKARPSIIIRNEAMEALESFSLECKPSERRVSVG
jgi:protein-tyrosine phosphatase